MLAGHGWDVKALDWHSKYGLLASGSKDNQVKLWDPRKRTCLATLYGHKHTVMKVAWNPVNMYWLLTASRDQTLKLYDIRILKNAQTFKGHNREVTSCAWHPVSERVFVSGAYDGTINHWIEGQEEPYHSHQAHDQAIWDVGYHPVGHVLATASNDHRVRFWARPIPGVDCVYSDEAKARLRKLAIAKGIDPDTLFDTEQKVEDTSGQTATGVLGSSSIGQAPSEIRPQGSQGARLPGGNFY